MGCKFGFDHGIGHFVSLMTEPMQDSLTRGIAMR